MIVHPEYRRRGIGTALLNRIETLFPTARRFELFTGHKSEKNIRLYERVGYRAFRQERVNEKVSLVFMEKTIRVREFRVGDKAAFQRLNEEWITRYFSIEEKDGELFDDPEGQIIAKGGVILILESNGEPVGCCALLNKDTEIFEVAKMAVTSAHQGKGLGESCSSPASTEQNFSVRNDCSSKRTASSKRQSACTGNSVSSNCLRVHGRHPNTCGSIWSWNCGCDVYTAVQLVDNGKLVKTVGIGEK